MCHSHAKCLAVILFVFCGVTVIAQTSNYSNPTNGRENIPYTKFGIGQMMNGNNTVLRGMGNVTSAFAKPYEVNTDNPASYSFLQRTTFEMGGTASANTISGAGQSFKSGTASVSYVNLGLPTSKNSGMCLGFRPYSRSYYNLDDTTTGTPFGNFRTVYSGEGNLNYAYAGAAAKYKGFSFGFNFGYLFGGMQNSTTIFPYRDTTIYGNSRRTSDFTNYNRLGGIYWKGGVLYDYKIDSEYSFRIGGTVALRQSIKERLNAYQIGSLNLGDTIVNDTIGYVGEQTGKMYIPMTYSIGVMFAKNDKWDLGLDYTATQWSGFSSSPDSSLNTNVGSMSYKISLGGQITPDMNNIRNYFARVTYRLGLYYGNDYLKINNNTLPYYGFTAGASLPFKRSLSRIHFAVDAGRVGATTNNMLQQTYVRFTFGFSFNDKWFIPRKYE